MKSAELNGISDYKRTHLHLHFTYYLESKKHLYIARENKGSTDYLHVRSDLKMNTFTFTLDPQG